jgi:hypothetical protein
MGRTKEQFEQHQQMEMEQEQREAEQAYQDIAIERAIEMLNARGMVVMSANLYNKINGRA